MITKQEIGIGKMIHNYLQVKQQHGIQNDVEVNSLKSEGYLDEQGKLTEEGLKVYEDSTEEMHSF